MGSELLICCKFLWYWMTYNQNLTSNWLVLMNRYGQIGVIIIDYRLNDTRFIIISETTRPKMHRHRTIVCSTNCGEKIAYVVGVVDNYKWNSWDLESSYIIKADNHNEITSTLNLFASISNAIRYFTSPSLPSIFSEISNKKFA